MLEWRDCSWEREGRVVYGNVSNAAEKLNMGGRDPNSGWMSDIVQFDHAGL